MSPSGKAAGSGPAIRGFESLHPSQDEIISIKNRLGRSDFLSFYFENLKS